MGVLSPSNHSVDRSLSSHLIAPTSGFGRFTGTDSMTAEAIVYRCDHNLTDRGTGIYRDWDRIP